MPSYSLTQAAVLLTSSSDLSTRVQQALVTRAVSRSAAAVGAEAAYVRRVALNPAGEANAALPAVFAALSVADAGTDAAPTSPTDAELAVAVTSAWSFLTG